MHEQQHTQFRLGAEIDLDQLDRDPYPVYALLREREPVSWLPRIGMWYLTRYDDVVAALGDNANFTVEYPDSLLSQVFGRQILSIDGQEHRQLRGHFHPFFTPKAVRERMEPRIHELASALIDEFELAGTVELRSAFAARLPVQVILAFFGLPLEAESSFREWYDSFEQALANFTRDPAINQRATRNVARFHELLAAYLGDQRATQAASFLATIAATTEADGVTEEEMRRTALTVFFGGISTVEALTLNTVWALGSHPQVMARIRQNPTLLQPTIEEVMRWVSPVQSATRRVTRAVRIREVDIPAGSTVSCMLGAANRDPAIFQDPDRFDIDRPNLRRHVGFAAGTHHCLGSHLARLEVSNGIGLLLGRLPHMQLDPQRPASVVGYEFRQPRELWVRW